MKKINEGLQRGDLNFVIKPVLSIDEYQSKIDDRKAIVVGFFTVDKEPAMEIARFVEKSDIDVLDTDVSPAPTPDGLYIAFIELDRNKDFITKLIKIVKEINNLTNIKEWKFIAYQKPNDFKLNRENLEKNVNLDPESIEVNDNEDELLAVDSDNETDKIEENILNFFKNSLVESVSLHKDILEFKSTRGVNRYRLSEFTNKGVSAPIIICDLNDPLLTKSIRLQNMLGSNYAVYTINEGLIVTDNEYYAILNSE